MNRVLKWGLLVGAMMGWGWVSVAHADQLSDVKAKGVLTCGVLANLEPFGFQDPNTREYTGYDVDFCNALLEVKGVACVPGSAFGEPKSLRISYTCPTPQLAPGLQRFQEFFAELT